MAQLGSASVWGTEGRGFKSRQPDSKTPTGKAFLQIPGCWNGGGWPWNWPSLVGLGGYALVAHGADAFNPGFQGLTRLEKPGRVAGHAHPRRGTGEDHITW